MKYDIVIVKAPRGTPVCASTGAFRHRSAHETGSDVDQGRWSAPAVEGRPVSEVIMGPS